MGVYGTYTWHISSLANFFRNSPLKRQLFVVVLLFVGRHPLHSALFVLSIQSICFTDWEVLTGSDDSMRERSELMRISLDGFANVFGQFIEKKEIKSKEWLIDKWLELIEKQKTTDEIFTQESLLRSVSAFMVHTLYNCRCCWKDNNCFPSSYFCFVTMSTEIIIILSWTWMET